MGTVRQQITIEASPRQVWNAFTTEAGVKAWWAEEARVDARDGGRLVLARGEGEGRVEERGSFHKVQPTREIEVAWEVGTTGPSRGTRLQVLLGRSDAEAKVHVVATGAALDDDAAREALDAFWKERLHALRKHLEG
jgi:uncharacterized protein YndB with AHSA1/START domain